MADFGTRLFTWLYGQKVGEDSFGNRYYREKKATKRTGTLMTERRWVIYHDTPEASKVPAAWHAWLHHTVKEVPTEADQERRYDWQRDHMPNMTGTPYAYRPSGHTYSNQPRATTTGDYKPWSPS